MTHMLPVQVKKRLGVFKFASCDGCQLTLLSCEDELLALADSLEIAYFLELSSHIGAGPFDIALVEGSITTAEDEQRIQEIRSQTKQLVVIGACATAGGIQALRNWANHEDYVRSVYAHPEYIQSLARSTAIADHVQVDFELRGCPISKTQLVQTLSDLMANRRPRLPAYSVCMECKRQGRVCVAVTAAQPCLGPVTQAGCGAICPSFGRACYGCFGPSPAANCPALSEQYLERGVVHERLVHAYRNMNASAPVFQIESDRVQSASPSQQERP